jgi:hypothetical protein
VADARTRSITRVRRAAVVLVAALTVALTVLAGCGSPALSGQDPLTGYWIGGNQSGQMTLIQIMKEGETYTVLANPDTPTGEAQKDGESLVVDTHALEMRFTPAAGDKLEIEFTGEMFKTPVVATLSRADETGYADAATAYGITTIRRGLAMWKAGGGKRYPPAEEVTPSGMLGKMIRWPTDMFTGQPMQPGTDRGEYTYAPLNGGKKYSLKGYLSDGSTIGK